MMKRMMAAVLVLGLATSTLAASQKEIELQGNFEGTSTGPGGETMPITAQIVALGKGKHVAKVHVGDVVVPIEGQTKGKVEDGLCLYEQTIDFGADHGGVFKINGKVEDRVFSGTGVGTDGTYHFSLNRVEKGSPTLGQAPPAGAIVLQDGSSMDAWVIRPYWQHLGDGSMGMRSSSIMTKDEFGSAQYHIEFKTPLMPEETPGSQGRGNSGVYVMGRYEVQVLDSFSDEPRDNRCGGIYKKAVPIAAPCLPPEEWQTYDITFHAPEFDGNGTKTKNATITAKLNGVTIHNNVELDGATPGGVSQEEAARGVLMLQDHHDNVNYRNIWVKPLG